MTQSWHRLNALWLPPGHDALALLPKWCIANSCASFTLQGLPLVGFVVFRRQDMGGKPRTLATLSLAYYLPSKASLPSGC